MNPGATMTTPSVTIRTLSFRAVSRKRGIRFCLVLGTIACAAVLLFSSNVAFANGAKRPRILGISGVTILVSDVPASRTAYMHLLAPRYSCDFCEDSPIPGMQLGSGQIIALQAAPAPQPKNLLDEIFFLTDDLKQMRGFLKSQRIAFEEFSAGRSPLRLRISDPDGHHISFVQTIAPPSMYPDGGIPLHLIHAGFIVRNEAAMDHLYRDILGFRPYWHGGMKNGETSWISLQVPDGTDWIEYMVNLPADPDQHLRGVMNHIAIGVADIQTEREQLVKNGVHLTEEPKLGRDGKWQLNLYDPDQTRIEFMEFTPKEKPCCSEYTGPHPKP
jgi:Glyoxalase/Bleomycin resistance protein/Dioxygenase superfamily.